MNIESILHILVNIETWAYLIIVGVPYGYSFYGFYTLWLMQSYGT